MTQEEVMQCVRAKLPSRMAITATWIQARYHCLQSQARAIIATLQDEGKISKEWDPQLGGYAVVDKL